MTLNLIFIKIVILHRSVCHDSWVTTVLKVPKLPHLDNVNSRSDFDVKETKNQRWKEYYLDSSQRDKTVRGHFISKFYKYLLHAEGGTHSEEQAMIHTR